MELTISTDRLRRILRVIGIWGTILILWNLVADLIFGYSAAMPGIDYFAAPVVPLILSAGGRPHWMIMLAQTAGWLYPIYALTYIPWWLGARRAGFWFGTLPVMLLVYAILMIGGIQHAGFAFLSVLEQARAVAGSTDPAFFDLASRYIIEHFAVGDLTAAMALPAGASLLAIGILRGKTDFPRLFVLFSPLGVLILTLLFGLLLPAPFAGLVLAPFGTWFLLVPNIAAVLWMSSRLKDAPRELMPG